MTMTQSDGSIGNNGLRKKSMSPAEKILAPPASHEKSNKPKPRQQQQPKSMNDDDDDEDEDDEDDD